ncbi:TetR/AcrR family transcriptional regulator C-terminal domain-containing protein [Plantactinospora sp. BC1]|uniref:TetR/AcrR family transcriptional regulator C-terminal domain-containing protein n=1 Tax=Plantactinospora sp. BC1 TaxID=2108470 RepID=UPI001F2A1998|nr:TetR/AcrR family transcriptional regulator C-terminal domain-containing protein [Plantactinospora sp. BC1]
MSRPEAPYLRIVDEIRRRIAAAELRPGDQVPSARQISQEWGVAIATATKVHAALRQLGLTEARPGIGTVVASAPKPARVPADERARRPRGPARPRGEGELSRERIVGVAIAVADADGLAELSMRRVATELDVATMSLYRYVAGKDELLLHMIDTVLGEEEVPPPSREGWRTDLARIARLEWRTLRRHPWLAPAMSITRPQLTPNTLALTDGVLHALDGLGLDSETQLYVHLTLFSFGRGLAAAIEPETEAQRDTGLTNDEWMDSQQARLAELAAAGSPLLRMALRNDFDFDLDRLFEFGLARLLDGLARHLSDDGGP